ncbi:MAG: tetratricopeptide repeat protein [Acidobacteria bacterium]|nr:tetratricopeptide repeat protein [Acidobacteriota bacterium]
MPLGLGLTFVAVALLLGLNVGGVRERLFGAPTPQIDSIAVLPLKNLSGDPEQEYFVEGMHEALTAELSKISALKVISRTSAMQYKDVKKAMPQIARELGVNGLIEGSVAREGDQVRITVQLIHGPSDRHLWAQSFDRQLRGILALHSEVARAIAREIKIAVTPAEEARVARTRPVNPEAYRLYILGRYHWNKRTPEGFKKAAEHFQQAIDLDPTYASPYTGLADNYVVQPSFGTLSPGDAYPRAKAAAQRALEIDASLAEPYATLGDVLMEYEWDWEGAERAFRRALELNPNYATAHQWYAEYLAYVGRHEEAIAEIKRAQELDPLSLIINTQVGWTHYLARQYDEAEEATRKPLEMDPSFPQAHLILGQIYLATGRLEEAAAPFHRALELGPTSPVFRASLAEGYARTGKREEARRILEQLEKESKERYVPAGAIALIYAELDEKDHAFHWLEKSLQQRDSFATEMKVEPRFDVLRSDPRFQDLLRRMNFPE